MVHSSKRDDTSNISPMMLPLILWDHAGGRVRNTNVQPAFLSWNHRKQLYTKNTQSYLMMWGRQ